MAIDTAEKRRAVAGVNRQWDGPSLTPNVAKDAEWRQQSGHSYSGIAAGTPATGWGRLIAGERSRLVTFGLVG